MRSRSSKSLVFDDLNNDDIDAMESWRISTYYVPVPNWLGRHETSRKLVVPKTPVFAYYSNFELKRRRGDRRYEDVMEVDVRDVVVGIYFVLKAREGVILKSILDSLIKNYENFLLPLPVEFREQVGSEFFLHIIDGSD